VIRTWFIPFDKYFYLVAVFKHNGAHFTGAPAVVGSKYNFRLRLYTDDTQTNVGLARMGGAAGTQAGGD
jgi:hypothetical protein